MKDLQPKRCSRMLRVLGDPERLRIIQLLTSGPRSVGELAEKLKKPIAAVSHHLRLLCHADVVEDDRQGRFVYYHLNPKVYQPAAGARTCDYLDLGCCRLEIPKE